MMRKLGFLIGFLLVLLSLKGQAQTGAFGTAGVSNITACTTAVKAGTVVTSASCPKTRCGPLDATDSIETENQGAGTTIWEPFSALTPGSRVLLCSSGLWTSLSASGAKLPTTPVNPPTPPAQVASIQFAWVAPTAYTTGGSITGPITYNVYTGTLPGEESATPVATGLTGTTYRSQTLSVGSTICGEITAVVGGVESAKSAEVCGEITAVAGPTPNSPTTLTLKIIQTTSVNTAN